MWPASFYLCSLKKSRKHSIEFTVEFSTGVVTGTVEACQKYGFSGSRREVLGRKVRWACLERE